MYVSCNVYQIIKLEMYKFFEYQLVVYGYMFTEMRANLLFTKRKSPLGVGTGFVLGDGARVL